MPVFDRGMFVASRIRMKMEHYVVCGGNPLVVEVEIGGAKIAALAILAASVITDWEVLVDKMTAVLYKKIFLSAMEGKWVLVKR